MGVTYRYLAGVGENQVLEWFRSLAERPIESPRADGVLFYFSAFGALGNPRESPLVSIFVPTRRCGVLTTIGEVHFLATPSTRFPELNRLRKRFHTWLSANPCVFSPKLPSGEWNYYLEGNVRNYDPEIYAFPEGMKALRSGAYFVCHDDSEGRLAGVCRQLDLRAVEGIDPANLPGRPN